MHHHLISRVVAKAEHEAVQAFHDHFLRALLDDVVRIIIADVEAAEPGVMPLFREIETLRTMPKAQRAALLERMGARVAVDTAGGLAELIKRALLAYTKNAATAVSAFDGKSSED